MGRRLGWVSKLDLKKSRLEKLHYNRPPPGEVDHRCTVEQMAKSYRRLDFKSRTRYRFVITQRAALRREFDNTIHISIWTTYRREMTSKYWEGKMSTMQRWKYDIFTVSDSARKASILITIIALSDPDSQSASCGENWWNPGSVVANRTRDKHWSYY